MREHVRCSNFLKLRGLKNITGSPKLDGRQLRCPRTSHFRMRRGMVFLRICKVASPLDCVAPRLGLSMRTRVQKKQR